MNRYREKLQQFDKAGRYRTLSKPHGVDLSSNDYLGFRDHPALRQAAIAYLEQGGAAGSGGSRLLRGHHEEHEKLEHFAAVFFGAEKALYFPCGYQANYSLFTTLPTRHDVILYDELIHASARDGIQASHAKSAKIGHNDIGLYEQALQRFHGRAEHIWIAVESLYSMEGDIAPLDQLLALAQSYEATLIVDEAHGTGVLGATGRGLCEAFPHENLITLHTCGKALGVAGGLLCASAEIIDYMVNTARPFIYSTAPPPLQAHLTSEALKLLDSEEGQGRVKKLRSLSAYVQQKMGLPSATPIVPLIIGDDREAVLSAKKLQEAGYDIRAIRPPTVPEGMARLRLSLNALLDEGTIDHFFDSFRSLPVKRAA